LRVATYQYKFVVARINNIDTRSSVLLSHPIQDIAVLFGSLSILFQAAPFSIHKIHISEVNNNKSG
jgi:hypothetical protein